MSFKKTLLLLSVCLASMLAIGQEYKNTSHIYQYAPTDGGILYTMTRGNKWAIINLGTSASGGDAVSQLFDMDSGEHFTVDYLGRPLPFTMASNDGNIVVGYHGNRAMTFDRRTKRLKSYPNRPLWTNGQLTDITPDGRLAVGYYQGYLGKTDVAEDLPNDWFFRTLMVNVETGDTIYTPNLPTTNRAGRPLQSIKFNSITPDGRYVMGSVDWYLDGGYSFIYDMEAKKTLTGTNLMQLYGGNVASRYPNVKSCSGSMLSPDGNAIGGRAQVLLPDGTTESVPCVYFRDRDELRVYDSAEDGNVNIEAMDNAGTFFGCTETGTPLRNFKILYNGKYWVTLNQICRQRYGYDFLERTGYERTGTIMGVSGDGHKFIAFPDPMGESYCFDFGETVEEACSQLDLLGNYTVTPEDGAQFAKISSIQLHFERPVQVLGNGKNVHLYDSKGQWVADGLSSSSALVVKENYPSTVIANFRTRSLTPGERYTVVIDAGAIATAKDASCVAGEVRVHYIGRAQEPVRLTESIPAAGSEVPKVDNMSNYVLLSFDCKVKLTDEPRAYIERVTDGTIAGTLQMLAGVVESTKHQLLLYPAGTINLMSGQDYRIVLEKGSVTDYSGDELSENERIVIPLRGTYVRPVPTGDILFADACDNIAESLQTWLRYEGDHNVPSVYMQDWEFDTDNQPWNFSIREAIDKFDYCAASHSMYSPSGKSDDWMMTPQITVPDNTPCHLEFDAQSYLKSCHDTLEVYVYPQEQVLSYLTTSIMEEVKKGCELVLKEVLSPGETEEYLSGEWTHFSIDLSPWAGQDIYIAFVNHNEAQSAIFMDNVVVQREVNYQLALDYEDRVLGQTEQEISGKLMVKNHPGEAVTLSLYDEKGRELARQSWDALPAKTETNVLTFAFDKKLPLEVGETTRYSIRVRVGDFTDTFRGEILSLAFQPTKHVVIEEMTGVTCINCPLGIITLEKLQKMYGSRVIPVSIHTYTGDPFESNMTQYSDFLGLSSAPSARINRVQGIYFPMQSMETGFIMSNPDEPLWSDVVAKELSKYALCDVDATAMLSSDGKMLECEATLKSAIRTSGQNYSLLFVVVEDGLVLYQANTFAMVSDPLLGEWGLGGAYATSGSNGRAYPVTHNDVARSVIGTTLGGTAGLFPSELQANVPYSARLQASYPTSVMDASQTHVVCMLIDTRNGEIINACSVPVRSTTDSIEDIMQTSSSTTTIYTLAGHKIRPEQMQKGHIYIINGKKVMR